MSEIRHNRLTNEWVIIAPERAKRGGNLGRPAGIPEVPSYVDTCPFCVGNEAVAGPNRYCSSGADGRWSVRSVLNKFSVLAPSGEVALSDTGGHIAETVNGVGLHEVIVEGPEHHLTTALYPVEQVERILDGYLHQFRAFYDDPRVRHVIVFKNHGAEAGASQQHPHSQIVGLPIVPGQIVNRLEHIQRIFAETGKCLGCTIIAQEQIHECRIVAENADYIAFIPYAALSPYHLWIFPKVHAACFSAPPGGTFRTLAELLREVLAKVYGFLVNPPFNLVVRSLSPREKEAPHFHWYISIVPRVNKTAGFELGTGMYVNPSLPESCAKQLREFRVA
jgi:UDPglucose--hexose-1-phosphate uridylyltransferase